MKFKFIGNACGIFEGSQGTRILCDPWIQNGVFEGSWCHYPPLTTAPHDLLDVDAVYVSHLHPDHFDERTFDFDRHMPIFVLDHSPNFLSKKLREMGFKDINGVQNGQRARFREFDVYLFAPFTKHPFHDAKIGNLIDSALVLTDGDTQILNTNDNTPDIAAAQHLRKMFGKFDLVMLNYNPAGPYPACFENLSYEEKKSEGNRILARSFDHISQLLKVFDPKCFLPFAGSYVLGGRLHEKNDVLGTTTWDQCAHEISIRAPEIFTVLMNEGQQLDLSSLTLDSPYTPINKEEMDRYITTHLAEMTYPHESDPMPDLNELIEDLRVASLRAKDRSRKFKVSTSFEVFVTVGAERVQVIHHSDDHFQLGADNQPRTLDCYLDPRLLRRVLDRRAHWNNSEIGCHIDFHRSPNIYEPDLHTILQFLHL